MEPVGRFDPRTSLEVRPTGLKFAYADPPYLGQAKKHYGQDEVDHEALFFQLGAFDGWALSCSSPSLYELLPLADRVLGFRPRIGAWVKPFASYKPGVNPAYAWEPVLFKPGRRIGRDEPTVRDWTSCNVTLKKGLVGAKPEKVCAWLFDLIGARPGIDSLDDLFPGTGIVSRCWEVAIGSTHTA